MNIPPRKGESLCDSLDAGPRGQRAWTRIKTTAAEQRQLWREVGEALRYGRELHPSNQAFGKWCVEEGFDMAAPVRSDALWLAASYNDCKTAPAEMSHPTNLRQWFREQQVDTPPVPSLHIETPSKLVAGIEVVAPIAKRINKLAAMAALWWPRGDRVMSRYLEQKCGRVSDEPHAATTPRTPACAGLAGCTGRLLGTARPPRGRRPPAVFGTPEDEAHHKASLLLPAVLGHT